jgi:hypothetical protein
MLQSRIVCVCERESVFEGESENERFYFFDLICVYWFSYRNRYKPVRVYISGVAP